MLTNPLDRYADIDFMITDVAQIKKEMLSAYERAYEEETGQSVTVKPASEARLNLYANAYMFHLAYQRINHGLKMNLLKYSTGEYLENLGAWFGISRNDSKSSYTTVEFELSQIQSNPINIPAGTRVSTSTNIFFETTEQVVIPKGSLTIEANVKSIQTGAVINDLEVGTINTIVDPIPFVAKVRNIMQTQGGADVETDEQLRTRIYNFPSSLSVAGPIDAYTYFALEFSQAIKSVRVTTPQPGHVDVRVMLMNDIIPEQAFLDELYNYLSNKDKRPLTDYLNVAAPNIINYNIEFTYYVGYENQDRVKEVQENVIEAVNEYIQWQSADIGRDINPYVLIRNLINAGAKRAEITSPVFTAIQSTDIAMLSGDPVPNYGGLEDD